MKFTLFLLLVFVIHEVFSTDKRWIQNTNFYNKNNWKQQSLPCKADRIIFPRQSPVVSVLKTLYLSDMILPLDGELVLGDSVSIMTVSPGDISTTSCPGTDTKYVRTKPLSWFDPSNWCAIINENICIQSPLHAAMVPSQYDNVMFPNPMDSYYVDVDYDDSLTIKGMNYRHEWQTTHGFRIYASSTEGMRQFVNTQSHVVPTISMSKKGCPNRKGCVPNTLNKKLFKKICSKVICSKNKCSMPISATGSCCQWCGSVIIGTIDDTFVYTSFESQMINTLSKWTSLKFHVMKISTDTVQIAITDDKGGEMVPDALNKLTGLLKLNKKQLGIASFSVKSSHGSIGSAYDRANKKNVSTILGVLFGVLAFVVVCFIVYEINRRVRNGQIELPQIQLPPIHLPQIQLPQFSNLFNRTTSRNIFQFTWSRNTDSGELNTTAGVTNMELKTTSTSFTNPVYRGSGINVTPLDDTYDEPMAAAIEEGLTNPVYNPSLHTKSDTEESTPTPIVIKRKEKTGITNLAFAPSNEANSSEA